jgi:hypothetical protein
MAGALALLIHLRGRHRIALLLLLALPSAGISEYLSRLR